MDKREDKLRREENKLEKGIQSLMNWARNEEKEGF
jgi:hypothetical protein